MSVSSISGPSPVYPTSTTNDATSSATTTPKPDTGGDGALAATLAATPAIASSTGANWLSEAQGAMAADSSGGLLGALQSSSHDSTPGSIASFLAQSQATANNLATIMQSSVQNKNELYDQIAQDEGQQAAEQRADQENALMNPPAQTNFTPPAGLPAIEYYDNGSSLDTTSNLLTMANGSQIDVTTGLPYIDPSSLVSLANGAYLNTTTNIITEADGTQIDGTTGLLLSTTA